MNEQHDVAALIRAGTPLLVIETQEEARVVELFRHVLSLIWRPLFRWTVTDGLIRLDMDGMPPATHPRAEPGDALLAIRQHTERGLYLLLDFHPYLNQPVCVRLLREIALRQQSAPHTVVLVSPQVELPEDLRKLSTRFELNLPDAQAIERMVREEAFRYSREHSGKRVQVESKAFQAIVKNLLGLSLQDARSIAAQLIGMDGALTDSDLPDLAKAKFELLNRGGVLSFEYETARFADVAGLTRLKRWIEQRRPVFAAKPGELKLDPPRGILMLGVQGCGKSLAAKAVAGVFQVPLMRMDFGAIYNKFQGESERNLRESLKVAESMSPCVLWIDEIEKGLAQGENDGGVSRRVLGTLLTWMAERKARVFVVATANAVHDLPPELLRKGRFDETFFVDLPDADSRAEIFRIHLDRRSIPTMSLDMPALAAKAAGFSGAEIEQVVVAASYAAHALGREPGQADLIDEIGATRPLSVLMAERVAALREWARERTVPAD